MAKLPPKKIELSEGYYLDNFHKLLEFIEEVYLDILQKEELEFLKNFKSSGVDVQRLFVRLVLRTKSFFRLSKLSYPEIDIPSALEQGVEFGLFEINPEIVFPDIAEPFTVGELKDFYKEHGGKKPPSKRDDLLEKLKDYEDSFYEWSITHDTLIWPLHQEVVEKLQMLFFANLHQDMAQFILEDIGVMKFEKVVIDKKTRYFESREHLEAHYQWSNLHAYLWEACVEKDTESAEEFFKHITKIKFKGKSYLRRFSRSCNIMAKLYESVGEYEKALKIYKKSMIEPARERTTRILEKMGSDKQALKICDEILSDPISEAEKYFARFFKEKLKRKLGLPYEKRKKLPTPEELVLPLKWEKTQRVEDQVLNYLMTLGYEGFFSENNYFGTLAALLFWEEYWSPGTGLFYHPFERGPRDFHSGEFYERSQKDLMRKRDYWINRKKTDWWKEISSIFEEKFLTNCSLTHWKRVEKKNLKSLIMKTPSETLLNISLQILKDPKQYRSGLPDLYLFHPEEGFHLGEVKSPNDQVQASQKRWFDFFGANEIPFKIYRLKTDLVKW